MLRRSDALTACMQTFPESWSQHLAISHRVDAIHSIHHHGRRFLSAVVLPNCWNEYSFETTRTAMLPPTNAFRHEVVAIADLHGIDADEHEQLCDRFRNT